MKKAYIITGLLLFGLFITKAQDSTSISLFDCLKKARNYHPYTGNRKNMEEIRSLKERNIAALWLPQLNINGQVTYQSEATKVDVSIPGFNIKGSPLDQYKLALDVNQVIYDGGLTKAERLITESSVDADLQQDESDIYKINDQVVNIYFNLLLIEKNKEVYTNTLNDLKSREQRIASNVKNGVLLQSDWDNLKAEIIKTNQLLDDISYASRNNFEIMKILTGDSLITNCKLIIPDLNFKLNDSIDRPELRLFDLQKTTLEGSKSLAGTQKMPKLYAFSQLGYGRPGLNMLKDSFQPYYIVGLKFQWNIWDWQKSQRDKSIYTVQQDMIGSRKENYLRSVRVNSKNELTKIQQLDNALKSDNEILTLRNNISGQTEKRLNQGVITMSDFLTEYNAEIKARLQLETHKIQLLQSEFNYMIIKGLLKN